MPGDDFFAQARRAFHPERMAVSILPKVLQNVAKKVFPDKKHVDPEFLKANYQQAKANFDQAYENKENSRYDHVDDREQNAAGYAQAAQEKKAAKKSLKAAEKALSSAGIDYRTLQEPATPVGDKFSRPASAPFKQAPPGTRHAVPLPPEPRPRKTDKT